MRSKGKLPTEMALLARKNVFTLVSQAELGFSLMQQKYGFVWTECTPTSSALSLWIYPTDWAIEGVSWKKWRVFLQGFNKQTLSVRLSAKNEWDVPDWFVPIDVCWVNQTYTVYIYIYPIDSLIFNQSDSLWLHGNFGIQLGTALTSETFCLSMFHHGITALRKNTPWRWWLLKDVNNNVYPLVNKHRPWK